MGLTNFVKNICNKLGEKNKATYAIVATATANGIFRPTFTMMKKGENPETKKYAALREGITEALAIPTYIACGEIAAKLGESIAEKGLTKQLLSEGKDIASAECQEMIQAAKKKGKAGLMLVGVCTAAGLVIPALCSVLVTPIMNKINKPASSNKHLDIKEPVVSTPAAPIVQTPHQLINRPVFSSMSYQGMKVGGV